MSISPEQTPGARQRVTVGVSGGVDSAVAAWQLQQQGYDVDAVFMQNWEEDSDDRCTAIEDYRDAAGICDQLCLSLETANFSAQYWDRVFARFLEEYNAGRTPNPDILCNSEIKFQAFLDYALRRGANRIATGHYARIDCDADGAYRLLRGSDRNKDQSYFLHLLTQRQLSRSLFPVGHLQKPELREIAQQLNLQVHDKRDSTGICFIGERRFSDFLSEYVAAQPGPIVTLDGQILGRHNGLAFYTIGQRQGLGIGGNASHAPGAWYAARKNMDANELVVVQGHDHAALHSKALDAAGVHWIRQRPTADLQCTARVRYRQQDSECLVYIEDGDAVRVEFADTVRAITPGQSVVFYSDDECLGGGIIERVY